jgi:hypothetical protein
MLPPTYVKLYAVIIINPRNYSYQTASAVVFNSEMVRPLPVRTSIYVPHQCTFVHLLQLKYNNVYLDIKLFIRFKLKQY